jgi:hypothetical protein
VTVHNFEVKSRDLSTMQHDDEANTLVVTFRQGARYQYEAVDLATVEAIAGARSVGKAFHAALRKHGYAYRRLADKKEDEDDGDRRT